MSSFIGALMSPEEEAKSDSEVSQQNIVLKDLDGNYGCCTLTQVNSDEDSHQHLGSSRVYVAAVGGMIEKWTNNIRATKISLSLVDSGCYKLFFYVLPRLQRVSRQDRTETLMSKDYKVTFENTPKGRNPFKSWQGLYPLNNRTWIYDGAKKEYFEDDGTNSTVAKFIQGSEIERAKLYCQYGNLKDIHNYPRKVEGANYLQRVLQAKPWGGYQIPQYIFEHLRAARDEYSSKKSEYDSKVKELKESILFEEIFQINFYKEDDASSVVEEEAQDICEHCREKLDDDGACTCFELTRLRKHLEEVTVWKRSLEEYIRWFEVYCQPDFPVERKKFLLLYSKKRNVGKTVLAKLTAGINPEYIEERNLLVRQIDEMRDTIMYSAPLQRLKEELTSLDLNTTKQVVPEWFTHCACNFQKDQFEQQENSKLLIVDDVKVPTPDQIEHFKTLLTSQKGVARDAYVNAQVKGGLPVIVCTNDIQVLHLFTLTEWFRDQGTAIQINRYIGPPGTEPSQASGYKAKLNFDRKTLRQLENYTNHKFMHVETKEMEAINRYHRASARKLKNPEKDLSREREKSLSSLSRKLRFSQSPPRSPNLNSRKRTEEPVSKFNVRYS